MTELLEEAISQLRLLPEEEQNQAAEALLQFLAREDADYRLTPEQVEEVRRVQAGLADGTTRLATDEEVEEMWRRFGA